MLHQPLGGASGQASDLEIQAREILKIKEILLQLLSKDSGQSIDRIAKDADRDYFMNAVQAKDYGLVDEVIAKHSEAMLEKKA